MCGRREKERDPRMGQARAASSWVWLEMGQGESSQSPGNVWWAEAKWPAKKQVGAGKRGTRVPKEGPKGWAIEKGETEGSESLRMCSGDWTGISSPGLRREPERHLNTQSPLQATVCGDKMVLCLGASSSLKPASGPQGHLAVSPYLRDM